MIKFVVVVEVLKIYVYNVGGFDGFIGFECVFLGFVGFQVFEFYLIKGLIFVGFYYFVFDDGVWVFI